MLPLDPVDQSPVGSTLDRVFGIAVVLSAVLFVVFLLQVQPDPRGHGTHEQFGMPKCGWVVHYGKPCPTCGVTTSGALLVRGRIFASVATQPFGAVLGLAGLALAVVALWCLARGRAFVDFLLRLPVMQILAWGLSLLLGSWGYIYWTFPT